MRGGRGALAILLALAALLVVGVPPSSAHRERPMSTGIEPDGSGTARPDIQFGSLRWEACNSHLAECKSWGRGREIGTNGAPAGTVFRVRNAIGEEEVTPEWKGPLTQQAPPRVAGVLQANGFVSPVPGVWNGGWREEPSEMQLAACITETGRECVTLTSRHYWRECPPSSSFYIDPRFTGWYLRVADWRSGQGHAEAAATVAYSPYGTGVWGRERKISVAIVGQIAQAVGPPAGECGPPPPPTATISSEGVARVECGGGCTVVLAATRKGHRQSVTRRIPAQNLLAPLAALEMSLPRPVLSRLGAGKVRLFVEVDGARLAQCSTRIPSH